MLYFSYLTFNRSKRSRCHDVCKIIYKYHFSFQMIYTVAMVDTKLHLCLFRGIHVFCSHQIISKNIVLLFKVHQCIDIQYVKLQVFPICSCTALDRYQIGGAVWPPVYTTPCILSKCFNEL